MTSKLFTAAVVASALFAGLGQAPALAQNTNTPAIDRAQQAISARFQQGMASGHITPSEARDLMRRDRDIDLRESRFKANGNITPQERQQLRTELDTLATEVERKMNNSEFNARPGTTTGIDNRQANLSQRIDEGIRSGRINQLSNDLDRMLRTDRHQRCG